MSAPAQSPEFAQAAEDAKKLGEDVTDQEKLKLYGLFKVGTSQSDGYDTAKKPGIMDFTGQAKYKAWGAAHKEKSSPEEAQKAYVEFVKELDEKYN